MPCTPRALSIEENRLISLLGYTGLGISTQEASALIDGASGAVARPNIQPAPPRIAPATIATINFSPTPFQSINPPPRFTLRYSRRYHRRMRVPQISSEAQRHAAPISNGANATLRSVMKSVPTPSLLTF